MDKPHFKKNYENLEKLKKSMYFQTSDRQMMKAAERYVKSFEGKKLYAMDSSLPSLRYTSWAQSLINLSYWMHITDRCLSCVFHFCLKFLSHWEQLCCVLSCLLFVRLFSNWPYKLNFLSIPAWPFFTFPFF